jgi:hypothetical protein
MHLPDRRIGYLYIIDSHYIHLRLENTTIVEEIHHEEKALTAKAAHACLRQEAQRKEFTTKERRYRRVRKTYSFLPTNASFLRDEYLA